MSVEPMSTLLDFTRRGRPNAYEFSTKAVRTKTLGSAPKELIERGGSLPGMEVPGSPPEEYSVVLWGRERRTYARFKGVEEIVTQRGR